MDLVQVADLSSDGRQDIVAIDWASANMAVFYQIPGGNLASAAYVPHHPGGWNDLKVADMNRDGRLDVVISSMQAAPGTQTVIILQRADGTFDAPRFPGYIFGPFAPRGIGLVDVMATALPTLSPPRLGTPRRHGSSFFSIGGCRSRRAIGPQLRQSAVGSNRRRQSGWPPGCHRGTRRLAPRGCLHATRQRWVSIRRCYSKYPTMILGRRGLR